MHLEGYSLISSGGRRKEMGWTDPRCLEAHRTTRGWPCFCGQEQAGPRYKSPGGVQRQAQIRRDIYWTPGWSYTWPSSFPPLVPSRINPRTLFDRNTSFRSHLKDHLFREALLHAPIKSNVPFKCSQSMLHLSLRGHNFKIHFKKNRFGSIYPKWMWDFGGGPARTQHSAWPIIRGATHCWANESHPEINTSFLIVPDLSS